MIEVDVSQQTVRPPPAPQIARRVVVARGQLAGVALLLGLPLLALFGVFGLTEEVAQARVDGLDVTVVYPARLRYKTTERLELTVVNSGDQAMPAVSLAIDHDYLAAFGEVRFTPAVAHVDARAYVFELGDIAAGATRRADVWLEADTHGRHRGSVAVLIGGHVRGQLALDTFALP